MSTPIDDTIGQAFDDLSGNVQTDSTEVVEPANVTEVEGTAEPEAEETKEESFSTKPVDLKTLPSELQEVYKDWQRSYTQKRQSEKAELADLRAEVESLRQQREGQPTDNGLESLEDENLTPEERVREEARKVFKEEQENLWIEQARKDYLELDERLNDDLPTHDPILDEWLQHGLDAEVEAYESENGSKVGFDYKSKAKELIGQWDKHVESLVTGFVQKQRVITRERADKSRKLNPEVSPNRGTKATKGMSIDEALETAFSES